MSATTAAPALVDAITFIKRATESDIDRMYNALKLRRQALSEQRAAAVTVGTEGTLTGLSPKYLNGLSGKVVAIRGKRADVELDEGSTMTLRFTRQTRFRIPANQERYTIPGVPLQCVEAKK